MVVVAVQHLDIDSRLGHPAGEQAELPGHVLLQTLNQDLPLREHLDPGRFESPAGGGAIGNQEMGDAPAVHDPGSSALDAHARTTQRLSHLRERAGPVFQDDRQVLHEPGTGALTVACRHRGGQSGPLGRSVAYTGLEMPCINISTATITSTIPSGPAPRSSAGPRWQAP